MAHRDGRNRALSRLLLLNSPTEEAALIRDNITNVFQPLIPSRSDSFNNRLNLAEWIQSGTAHTTPSTSSSNADSRGSIVINVEDMPSSREDAAVPNAAQHNQQLSNIPDSDLANSNDHSSQNDNNTYGQNNMVLQNLSSVPEAIVAFEVIKTYFPFIAIILAKLVFDYSTDILLFMGLFGTFTYYNNKLKQEIAHYTQPDVWFLLFSIVHLQVTICLFYYLYYGHKMYLSLVFISPFSQPPLVVDLLWMICSNDFIVRLMTIVVKTTITLIPLRILPARHRGKWYVSVETTSQLYRSLLPVQPWLYYLLDSYQGPQMVVGVFVSAAYMVAKGRSLMKKVHTWWASLLQLVNSAQFDVNPTKDQLNQAGLICPICHESYETPVLLSCRHIFCEGCVGRWLNYEQTCPMCRAKVFKDPSWRDGCTTHFIEFF